MDKLTQNSFNVPTMSSREIATLTGKKHYHIMRDIELLAAQLEVDVSKFGGIYTDSMNRGQTEYLLDKDTCLCLVAGYNAKLRMAIIKRWQELEPATTPTDPQPVQPIGELEDKMRVWAFVIEQTTLAPVAKETLLITTAETLTGVSIGYRPQIEQTTYSAKELGDVLGISANRVGRIANAHGLKTKEYGLYYLNKSQHSDKQVEHFRYFEKAIDKFKSILENA